MNLLKSTSAKILMIFLLVILPIILLVICSNFYAMNLIEDQVTKYSANNLEMYIRQLEKDLDRISSYMLNTITYDDSLISLQYSKTRDTNYHLQKQKVYNKLTQDIKSDLNVSSYFIKTEKDILYTHKIHLDNLNDFVFNISKSPPMDWSIIKVEGAFYILRVVENSVGTRMGALINCDDLVHGLKQISEFDKSFVVLLSHTSGEVYWQSNDFDCHNLLMELQSVSNAKQEEIKISYGMQKYYCLTKNSAVADLSILIIFNSRDIFRSLSNFEMIFWFLPIAILIIMFIFNKFLRNIIFIPLEKLHDDMENVSKFHKQESEIVEIGCSEIVYLTRTFKSMLHKIHILNTNMYEQKIKNEQVKYEYLQSQIKPHFLTNCLNIIYSLATIKNYEAIMLMSKHLAELFRYISSNNAEFSTLNDEINNIINFFEIYKLRYGEMFDYKIDKQCDINLKMPMLTVQTFAENCIKHGIISDNKFIISIKIYQDGNDIVFIIKDNGRGFSDDVLKKYNKSFYETSKQGGLGLANVCQRLKYIYSNGVDIIFSNDEGACVKIIIRNEGK